MGQTFFFHHSGKMSVLFFALTGISLCIIISIYRDIGIYRVLDNMATESSKEMQMLTDETLGEAAACLKVMAHPVRLKIVDILTRLDPSVGELAEICNLPHNQVCEHLRLMQNCGLLTSIRSGRSVHYKIDSPRLPALIGCIRQNCKQT